MFVPIGGNSYIEILLEKDSREEGRRWCVVSCRAMAEFGPVPAGRRLHSFAEVLRFWNGSDIPIVPTSYSVPYRSRSLSSFHSWSLFRVFFVYETSMVPSRYIMIQYIAVLLFSHERRGIGLVTSNILHASHPCNLSSSVVLPMLRPQCSIYDGGITRIRTAQHSSKIST